MTLFVMPSANWLMWIALRTFVYYNASLLYVFTGNALITWGGTFALELFFSLLLYMTIEQKRPVPKGYMTAFYTDTAVACIMTVVATFVFIATMYVGDSVIVIGDMKNTALAVFLFFVNLSRVLLLLLTETETAWVVLLSLCAIFLILIALLTDSIFWVHSHTITVYLTFTLGTVFAATLLALRIGYFAYLVHLALVGIGLAAFWHEHSKRSFNFYLDMT